MWGWKRKFLRQNQKTPDCPLAVGRPSHPEEVSREGASLPEVSGVPHVVSPAAAALPILELIAVLQTRPGVQEFFFLKLGQALGFCDP